ncbi:MAG: sugar phosphate nucleotidyltransferase [candidate division WOR-3 bacterium]
MLAGGQGERFWPLSQPDFPKQFLSIFNKKPLIVQTIDRIADFFKEEETILIIPEELSCITKNFVRKGQIVIEPVRRNTAPAICLVAMKLKEEYGDGIMHIMPADHLIRDKRRFLTHLKFGEYLAQNGYLVTYGINPTRPETGYGYIKIGEVLKKHKSGIVACEGKGFTEKPDRRRAKVYLRKKTFLWNSGIFTFKITDIIREMEYHIPDVSKRVKSYLLTGERRHFEEIREISIDYGVMEKAARFCVIKADFSWDDVGSWLALERYFKGDCFKNIFIGDALGLDSRDSIVYSYNIPVKVYGIKKLVVVACPKGVLVCKKERASDLKNLLRIKG